MFLYKSKHTDARIRLYEYRYIGVYSQDLIVFSTYVV